MTPLENSKVNKLHISTNISLNLKNSFSAQVKCIYGKKGPVYIITVSQQRHTNTSTIIQTFVDKCEIFYDTFLIATYLVVFAHVSSFRK